MSRRSSRSDAFSDHHEMTQFGVLTTIPKKYPLSLPIPSTLLAGMSCDDDSVQTSLEQYSLLVEFSTIHNILPSGVYVMPDKTSKREWNGLLFLRQGWYRGAIYRFKIAFSEEYPNECPRVTFLQPIPPHPLIDPNTGYLELNHEFPNWNCQEHSSLHVIGFIKRIFYDKDVFAMPSDDDSRSYPNAYIKKLFDESPSEFLTTIEHSIQDSFRQGLEHAANERFLDFTFTTDSLLETEDKEIRLSSELPVFTPTEAAFPHGTDSIQNETHQRQESIARALHAFSNETHIVNPRDAFLDWLNEEYVRNLQMPSPEEGTSPY